MHPALFARTISILTLTALLSVPFIPYVVYAQNICEVANAECPEDLGPDTGLVPCACPILGLVTIAGVCIAPMKCQAISIIPTPTTSGLLVGGGLAASTLLTSLFSGGSGDSSQSSDTFDGGLATVSLAPSDFTSSNTSLYSNTISTAHDDGLDTLIAGLGKTTTTVDLTTAPATSCVLPITGNTPIDQLERALPAPAPSCLI